MMLEVLRVIDKKITSPTNRSERRQLQQKKQSKKIYSRFLFFSLFYRKTGKKVKFAGQKSLVFFYLPAKIETIQSESETVE